jgi:hypothetical protein
MTNKLLNIFKDNNINSLIKSIDLKYIQLKKVEFEK